MITITIFISYARADGQAAAARLRGELAAMGFQVWRDAEEMCGGQDWKEQLRAALRAVDAVAVLLTPAAVASTAVTWEWENALTLEKQVLPLLVQPCDVPAELGRLHYHRLDEPAAYSLGLARLVRDLLALPGAVDKPGQPAAPPPAASKYTVIDAHNSIVGDCGMMVNVGSGRVDAVQLLAVLEALTRRSGPGQAEELQRTLQEIRDRLGGVERGVADLRSTILARIDLAEQRIIWPILARLDAQQLALTDAILQVIDVGAVAAGELDRRLDAVAAAVLEVSARPALLLDSALAGSVQDVARIVGDPALAVKHKLKLALPIVPLLLSYEGEIEWDNRANLQQAWRAMVQWTQRRQP